MLSWQRIQSGSACRGRIESRVRSCQCVIAAVRSARASAVRSGAISNGTRPAGQRKPAPGTMTAERHQRRGGASTRVPGVTPTCSPWPVSVADSLVAASPARRSSALPRMMSPSKTP